MSRTCHHSQKHGSIPLGEGHKQRAYGYEFGSRGLYSWHGPGRYTKKLTNRKRRRNDKST